MTPDQPPDDIDQQIRINELKHRVEEMTGCEMVAYENPDAPPEVVESFWENVVKMEEAGWTSQAEELAKDGYTPPPPENLATDEVVHTALWELIRRMAAKRAYLSNTNHLSDRGLYELLVGELLHECQMGMAIPGMNFHLDILGSGCEEDTKQYMRYYADDDYRARWMKDFPGYVMPPKETPPFDRDRLLPQAKYD